jgi:hypothetical protein
MPLLDILAYIGATTLRKIIEVAVAPTEVAAAPTEVAAAPTEVAAAKATQMSESKHDLAAIKARAKAHHLKGPYEAPDPALRRSERIAARRDYIFKGDAPTKFHVFGTLFYNGYRTFSMSGPKAANTAFAALADNHYTVALDGCTLADPIITLKVGGRPDPHRLITEKGEGKVAQYMVNAAGQRNGFYKEWADGKLVLSERFKENIRY